MSKTQYDQSEPDKMSVRTLLSGLDSVGNEKLVQFGIQVYRVTYVRDWPKILDEPVTVLNVNSRVRNFFERATNIATLGDLCEMREDTLLKYRNIGKMTVGEIKKALLELGLELAG